MTEEIKYRNIKVPNKQEVTSGNAGKPSEWHWTKRRAYLYQRLKEEGYLTRPQRYYAKLFNVTQGQISQDLKKVKEELASELSENELHSEIKTVGNKALTDLIDENPWKAFNIVERKAKLLQDFGIAEKQPEEHEGEFTVNFNYSKYSEEDE